ncbi:MAG: hypothetical protein C0490_00560 [Marivirga sp.]|nr:hypothetical protein [Marivirga sp.]
MGAVIHIRPATKERIFLRIKLFAKIFYAKLSSRQVLKIREMMLFIKSGYQVKPRDYLMGWGYHLYEVLSINTKKFWMPYGIRFFKKNT